MIFDIAICDKELYTEMFLRAVLNRLTAGSLEVSNFKSGNLYMTAVCYIKIFLYGTIIFKKIGCFLYDTV
jgi:hypothetical protein